MASKRYSAAFYRAAVLGVKDEDGNRIPGLRSVARGFEGSDGYDMRRPLTPARKRRVREYWHELQRLNSQPKVLFRTPVGKNLRRAQAIVGQDLRFQFKVAFIPHVPVRGQPRPQIEVTDDSVVVETKTQQNEFLEFNPSALARNPGKEIDRIISEGGKDSFYHIRADVHIIKLLFDAAKLKTKIFDLMEKYDGHKPLPSRSKNKDDRPRDHYWGKWLKGVQVVRLKRLSTREKDAILDRFTTADKRNKERNVELRKKALK